MESTADVPSVDTEIRRECYSRRRFLRLAGLGLVAVPLFAACAPAPAGPTRAEAPAPATDVKSQQAPAKIVLSGELKVIQWGHFVPGYDVWFDNFAADWGARNNVRVTVDHVGIDQISARSVSEAQSRSGHDIFGFFHQGGPSLYDDLLVDLSDIVEDLGRKYGGWSAAAETLGRPYGKWKAVPDFVDAQLSCYRKDILEAVGLSRSPDTWDELLKYGELAKAKGSPIGIALTNCSDAEATWRAVLWCFGGKEVEQDGKTIALDSKETRAALEYSRTLYEKAMTSEVLSWDDASNNRYLASGKGSWIYNPISVYRTIEKQDPELFKNIYIGLPLAGPAGRFVAAQFTLYGIWNFSRAQDAAKEFLRAYKLSWPDNFKASEGFNMPFENDLLKPPMPVLGDDPKLKGIQEAPKYMQTPGFPGPNTVAASEVLDTHVISDLFSRVATGQQSADQSIAEAVRAMTQIYGKRR
jgi:multiple sugar transport system substrate-binding protein